MPRKQRPDKNWRPARRTSLAETWHLTNTAWRAIRDCLFWKREPTSSQERTAKDWIERDLRAYSMSRKDEIGRPRPKQVLTALNDVVRAGGRFVAAIDELDHESWVQIWWQAQLKPLVPSSLDPFNPRMRREGEELGAWRYRASTMATVTLIDWAKKALDGYTAPNGETAVNTLVLSLARIWKHFTKEAATRAADSTFPNFVKAVCRCANPSVGTGAQSAAMKYAIHQLGGRRGRSRRKSGKK